MCVIAVSKKGDRQPSVSELRSMWDHNPHGAGYMFARDGKLEIHKGFMDWNDFIRSVRYERFTSEDSVVYHFRIATQGGINPYMTHPFPITHVLHFSEVIDLECEVGVAHNGIIPITSSIDEKKYSDTALFVCNYLSWMIRYPHDINNKYIQKMISELGGNSKFALMNYKGEIATIGLFYNHNGVLLSNENHLFRSHFLMKGGDYKCIASLKEKCV